MGIFRKGKKWYIDNYYLKGRRKRKRVGPSKKLSEQVLKDVQVNIARGEYLRIYDEKNILFEDHARHYLDFSRANKAWSTYRRRDRSNVDHKWSRIDLENRRITVINAKNNESRVIPLNRTLYDELLDLSKKPRGEYVFGDRSGRPYGDIKKGFSSALKKAGIGDFRFHDLRHTFGSHLVMQGVDLRTIQQVMGHKEIRMTMRYSHLSHERVREAIEKLDSLWTVFGHRVTQPEEVNALTL